MIKSRKWRFIEMSKFEYKVIPLSKTYCHKGVTYEVDQEILNDLGNDGWELIQIANRQLVFKRELSES